MSPDVIKSKMQIAEEIIHKLEEFIRSEQAFSQDYYISATEPLLQLEDLLDYCRLHLPHRLDLIERTEQERNRLFEWARIANKTNDAEAKGKTKGFAIRLVKKLQQILELLREGLAAQNSAETEQNATHSVWTCVKRIPRWIYYILGALAALLTVLHLLGWLEPIKGLIYKMLLAK